jgi:hypothetical protein
MNERPVYTIKLRPLPGVDAVRALRALLKHALRRCGLKAVSVEEGEPTVKL